jgi:ubiquinone biosynthesis protein COQ4
MTSPALDTRFRFGDAWRALVRLRQDPDDTAAVFEIIRALTGKSGERQFRRYRATEQGARVLARRQDLLPLLRDRAYLDSLPEGSLGREYAAFTAREQISADGLVDASETVERVRDDEDRARFFDMLRDSHDLEHVITGWGRDLLGEIGLLAFDTAQAWHHGIALIVFDSYLRGGSDVRRMIRSGWRRGRRARWLSALDWAELLPRPLDELREELGVGDPPVYEPVWSAGAPAAA